MYASRSGQAPSARRSSGERIRFPSRADEARQDEVAALDDRPLEMNKGNDAGKPAPSGLDRLEREIAPTDQEIGELVYEPYGITGEERATVEGTR